MKVFIPINEVDWDWMVERNVVSTSLRHNDVSMILAEIDEEEFTIFKLKKINMIRIHEFTDHRHEWSMSEETWRNILANKK